LNSKEEEIKLKGKIQDDYEKLTKYYQEGRFGRMAEILGDNTVLISPEGMFIKGKRHLARYWRSVKASGKNRVVFRSIFVYVNELKPAREVKDPRKVFLHGGHEISEFRLISRDATGKVENCTGTWGRGVAHPLSCVWVS
jgi:hypothetical protein